MTHEAIKKEIAETLQLNDEKYLLSRAAGLGICKTCTRCGGSGRYSYNQIDGSRCYGCNGHGQQLPKNRADWEALRDAAERAASDGSLDEYIERMRRVARGKRVKNRVMAAWKDTGISDLYRWTRAADAKKAIEEGEEISDEDAEHLRLSRINRRMSEAYDRTSDAVRYAMSASGRAESEALYLDALEIGEAAIEEIREAAEEIEQPELTEPVVSDEKIAEKTAEVDAALADDDSKDKVLTRSVARLRKRDGVYVDYVWTTDWVESESTYIAKGETFERRLHGIRLKDIQTGERVGTVMIEEGRGEFGFGYTTPRLETFLGVTSEDN